MNPFDFFEMEPAPIIDLAVLRVKYIELQKSGHPDLGYNDEISENANKYYSLLKSDEGRVELILKQYGTWPPPIDWVDSIFLMEAMELGEEIDDLDRNNPTEISRISAVLEQLLKDQKNELSEIYHLWFQFFEQNHKDQILKRLSVWYQKGKYIARLQKNLNQEKEI